MYSIQRLLSSFTEMTWVWFLLIQDPMSTTAINREKLIEREHRLQVYLVRIIDGFLDKNIFVITLIEVN